MALWLALVAATALAVLRPWESDAPTPETVEVVVTSGQTLWEIARTVAPDADPRATIATIMKLNVLDGGSLTAGERLLVPAPDPG